VALRQCEGHGRVRQTALIAPRLVPEPLVPRRGRPSRLRRVLAMGPSDTTAPMPALGRYIPVVRPRSGGLDLTRVDLILALQSGSNRPSLFPHSRVSASGPS
jgi:hypothetical protein